MLLLGFFSSPTLSDITNIISIVTPIVLIAWFYYSQKNTYSKEYYSELAGSYAGFTDSVSEVEKGNIYAGVIMQIVDIDSNGYIRGELEYGENLGVTETNSVEFRQIRTGVHTFAGFLEFKMYWKKKRDPFNIKKNRIYKGRLYIVHRLDYQFEEKKLNDYTERVYEITHFRELRVLEFKLKKVLKNDHSNLPKKFTLYRDMGLSFEPSRSVRVSAFAGDRVIHSV